MQADCERLFKRRPVAKREIPQKNFEKLFKNPLTNSRGCGIIVRLSKRTARQEQSESSARSLTIEQQEIKVQAKA